MTTTRMTMTQMIEFAATGMPILSNTGTLDSKADALIAATERLIAKWEAAELDALALQAAEQERRSAARLATAKTADPDLAARVAARRAARNADRKF
jgi:hypothetical protein